MPSVKVGMKILTSGFGGIFPPDIPVAEITAIQGEIIHATPLVNPGDVDHVLLLT
jgi:rod shape-determining protein MreC